MSQNTEEDRYLHPENFADKFETRSPLDFVLKFTQHIPGRIGHMSLQGISKRIRAQAEDDFMTALKAARPGSLCVDLGANVGKFTNLCLDAGMRVISFEPDPDTFQRLSRDVKDHPDATLYNQAVGIRADRLRLRRLHLWTPDQDVWTEGSSVVFQDALMDDDNSVEVEVIDFVSFLQNIDERVAILKVDIEGSEWELFPALIAAGALEKIDYIFMETHEWRDADKAAMAQQFRDMARSTKSPVMNFNWM